ncbi:hypothetical protein HDV00_012779 [Rhizophlyctis rosea]|nr:hypothetical protein HDV00_012779 [Rhizophlyctis rosea]
MSLLNIPNELVSAILDQACTDFFTAKNVRSTCKALNQFFDVNTEHGKRLWKRVRTFEDLPDGSACGIDDFTLLRVVHTKGCNFFDRHPQVKTPIWEYGGVKMCKDCFPDKTIRNYCIEDPVLRKKVQTCLPYVLNATWRYKTFLKRHVDAFIANNDEIFSSQESLEAFKSQMSHWAEKKRLEDDARIERRKLQRQREVDAFIKTLQLLVDITILQHLQVYLRESQKVSPFNKRAQTMFKNKLLEAVETHKSLVVEHQLRRV